MSNYEETSTWPDSDLADPDELDPELEADPETEPAPWSGLSSGDRILDDLAAEEESESDENEELEAEHEE